MGASMAMRGKAAPQVEKLSTPQREQILMDMRREGMRPKMKTPKPCDEMTARSPRSMMSHVPPGWGKLRCPKIYQR